MFNHDEICKGFGLNKKEAKSDCAKKALCNVAPTVFQERFPEELQKLEVEIPPLREPQQVDLNQITIGDDSLLGMPHLWQPYTPLEYLETFCQLSKNEYSLQVELKQGKESSQSVFIYICVKKHG
jgi:hypothetical protein